MEEYIFQHLKNRERVCDNNCEPSKSLAETLTDAPAFKYVDIFEGIWGLATIPLCQYIDYCCEPFKNRNELFKVLDGLRENNSDSTVFEENEIEKILYRMFPTDYSSSFNIDGIATDDFDKQFVLVSLDDNNIVSFTTDPDGNLKSKENPSEYKDSLSKDKKYNKIRIRKLLKKIAIFNTDIYDLSIFNETTDDEYWKEKQEVCRLKEEVWKYYIGEHNEGEQYIYNQVSEVVTSVLSTSNNTPKRKKQKKSATVTSEKPMTIKYFKHGNKSLLRKQEERVDILYKKWTEWKWIDKDTRPEDFDRLFEGSPCHCNISWIGTSATLTILLQRLLMKSFIERQTGCSAKHLVTKQFGKTANSSKSRINTETDRRIEISILILDTNNPLLEQNSVNAEEYDIRDAALNDVYGGLLRSTKGI